MFRKCITLLAVAAAHSMGNASAQTKVYDPSVTFSTGTKPVFGIHVDDVKKTVSVVDRDFITLARPHRLTWSTWLRSNGTKVRSFTKEIPFALVSVSFSADGKWVIAGGGNPKSTTSETRKMAEGRLIVWDTVTGTNVHDWTYPEIGIFACRASPSRDQIAIIAATVKEMNENAVSIRAQIIDSVTGKQRRTSPEQLGGFPIGMCFSGNGRQVHICHLNHTFGLTKETPGASVTSYGKRKLRPLHSQPLKIFPFSGMDTFLRTKVCATDYGWVTVCGTGADATEWFRAKSIGHIIAGSRRNRRIVWSFQDVGTSRASSSRDGLIVYNNIAPINVRGFGYNHIAVRSAKTGELIYQLRGQKTSITGLALANSGRQVVSADDKGTIRVWDLPPMAKKGESPAVPKP